MAKPTITPRFAQPDNFLSGPWQDSRVETLREPPKPVANIEAHRQRLDDAMTLLNFARSAPKAGGRWGKTVKEAFQVLQTKVKELPR